MRTLKAGCVLVPLLFVVACGGDDDITGPSNRIPDVAGNYSGTTTLTLPELGQTMTCPTTTRVTQSGNSVSIAPLVLAGQCGNMSLPMGTVNIDATGSFGQASFTTTESCGVYNGSGSGGFFGRDLRLSVVMTSTTCWNINMTVTLSR